MTTYDEQTWAAGQLGGTPLNVPRLTHIEEGIGDAHEMIAALQELATLHAGPGWYGGGLAVAEDPDDPLDVTIISPWGIRDDGTIYFNDQGALPNEAGLLVPDPSTGAFSVFRPGTPWDNRLAAQIADLPATGTSLFGRYLTLVNGAVTWVDLGDVAATTAAVAAATSAATASTLVKRDSAGRVAVAAPAATGDAATMGYVVAAVAAMGRDLGTGTSLPTTGPSSSALRRGDIYYHTGVLCLLAYTGSNWRQATISEFATKAARDSATTTYAATAVHDGFKCRLNDSGTSWDRQNGTWAWVSGGAFATPVNDTTAAGPADLLPTANFTNTLAVVQTMGNLCRIEIAVTIKTTAIAVGTNGDIANTNVATIGTKYRPPGSISFGMGASGPGIFGYLASSGNVTATATTPNYNVASTSTQSSLAVGVQLDALSGWYPLTDPNLIY